MDSCCRSQEEVLQLHMEVQPLGVVQPLAAVLTGADRKKSPEAILTHTGLVPGPGVLLREEPLMDKESHGVRHSENLGWVLE